METGAPNVHGSVELVCAAALPCTACVTLLLPTAKGSCGAMSAAMAAAVEASGASVSVAPNAPTADCVATSPSTVWPLFVLLR